MENIEATIFTKLVQNGWDPNAPIIGITESFNMAALKDKRMIVTGFTLLASLRNGELIEFSRLAPYGFIHIDSPDFPARTVTSILNKIDFANAWRVRSLLANNLATVRYRRMMPIGASLSKFFPIYEFNLIEKGTGIKSQIYGV